MRVQINVTIGGGGSQRGRESERERGARGREEVGTRPDWSGAIKKTMAGLYGQLSDEAGERN